MMICPITREQLLAILPRDGAVAEIGVAKGAFSESILSVCNPRKLFLIDPWARQERDDYQNDESNAPQEEQDRRYQEVRAKFSDQIAAGRVSVIRDYSASAARDIPDGSLDWVYVDGLHSRQAVLEDLWSYYPKVTDDGLIVGHDFANHQTAESMGFGVVQAVEQFVGQSGCRMLAVTNEIYPTFVLAKNPDGPTAARVLQAICYAVPNLVEVPDWRGHFRQRLIRVGDRTRVILRIGSAG